MPISDAVAQNEGDLQAVPSAQWARSFQAGRNGVMATMKSPHNPCEYALDELTFQMGKQRLREQRPEPKVTWGTGSRGSTWE